MKKSIQSILSFILFGGIYFYPIAIISFFIGFLLLTGSTSSVESNQAIGWYMIIVSYFISIIISSKLSILTVKKTILRKVKEDGTKEKIPKYIFAFIIIALLFNSAIIGYRICGVILSSQIIPETEEPVKNPIIYNIDVSKEIYDFEDSSYVSNSYMFEIKDNYENNYIVNFNNLLFQNNTYQISYEISGNKKTVSINDKKIVTKNFEDENLVGISIYTNYLKIFEMVEKEHTINKSIIIDSDENIIYEYYNLTEVGNLYNAFEIIDDTNKNNITYKMYNLKLNSNIFEINDLVELNFNCNNIKNDSENLTEENKIKYYICNK